MNNYLIHYGVRGMHWGERRYQNPDGSLTDLGRKHYGSDFARKSQDRLNILDRDRLINQRRASLNEYKSMQYKNAANAIHKFTKKNTKLESKLSSKSKKHEVDATKARRDMARGQKETDKILKNLENKGYTVSTTKILRNTTEMEDYINQFMIGYGMSLTLSALRGAPTRVRPNVTYASLDGTKYKVSK